MTRLANTFLVGAPKCGTTTMAYWLGQHPACFVPASKEPSWFSTDLLKREKVTDYEALLSPASPEQDAIIDASTDYFYSQDAIDNILRYNAEAKFVVMLRHPADLLWAWHRQVLFNAIQTEASFEKAFRGKGKVARGYDPAMVDYRRVAAIGTNVKRVIDAAGRARVHVILFEDLVRDREGTLFGVQDFLGLSRGSPESWDSRNVGVNRRSALLAKIVSILRTVRRAIPLRGNLGVATWVNDMNRSKKAVHPDPKMMSEITKEMAPEVALLEDLIGVDLTAWKHDKPRPVANSGTNAKC